MWNQSLVMNFLKINNNAKLQYTLACYQDSDGKSGVFFWEQNFAKMWKMEGFLQKNVKFPTKQKKISKLLPTFGL